MSYFRIFIGSMTGTAESLANMIANDLRANHRVDVFDKCSIQDLDNDADVWLFCLSNTGAGDIPDNLVPLYQGLLNEYPPIAGKKYAIINLGDSSFITYGEAGQKLDEALSDLGATALHEMLTIDMSEAPNLYAVSTEWMSHWLNQ